MQIQAIAAKLQAVGLSEKEARVYVAALFLGPAPVQKIAEQAGVNRATTYIILDELSRKGLISQSNEGKKTLFVAEDPQALEQWLAKQAQNIQSLREAFTRVLPELETIRRADSATAPVVRFYKGTGGAKAVNAYLRRKAKPSLEIYGMSNVDEVLKVLPDFLEQNLRFRIAQKISSKFLYSYAKGNLPSGSQYRREAIRLERPVRADITFYEDTAMFLTYEGEQSVGIVIESKEIVGALRQLFELAWKGQQRPPSVA